MFVQGYCRIDGWPREAIDDLERLLCGESPEWQGQSWTRITLSEYWDIQRGADWIEIGPDSANDEPFEVDDLILMAQSVMRRHDISSPIRIESWGLPEGAESRGDGQATYVNRYGSIHINPMTSAANSLDGLRESLDRWKREADLMENPERRKMIFGKDINIWASAKGGTVYLGSFDSFWQNNDCPEMRALDIAVSNAAHEIVVNVADFYPGAKAIVPRSLPHDLCLEISKAAQAFGLSGEKTGPKPK